MFNRPLLGLIAGAALTLHIVPLAAQTPESNARQPTNSERKASGPADRDIRVGVYVNVRPDCSSGPLPTIRLAEPPGRGKVNVKSGKVKATNYKQCLALEVPAYVAFYRSEPNFTGVDSFVIEVKYPNGRTENQKINVTIGGTAPAAPGTPDNVLPRPPAPSKQQSI